MYDHHIPMPTADSRQSIFALNELITITRELADTLNDAARHLHEDLGLSVPERSILLELRKNGPLTVPALARQQEVSRQFIQATVNPLLGEGLLESQPNPAHRRSRLLALSTKGTELIRQVMRREGALMQEWASQLAPDDLRQAVETMQQVHKMMAREAG